MKRGSARRGLRVGGAWRLRVRGSRVCESAIGGPPARMRSRRPMTDYLQSDFAKARRALRRPSLRVEKRAARRRRTCRAFRDIGHDAVRLAQPDARGELLSARRKLDPAVEAQPRNTKRGYSSAWDAATGAARRTPHVAGGDSRIGRPRTGVEKLCPYTSSSWRLRSRALSSRTSTTLCGLLAARDQAQWAGMVWLHP